MTILGLTVPEDQQLWFWDCGGDGGVLFFAKDHDEAYRKALAARLGGSADPDDIADNRRWFSKNDTLTQIEGEYTGPAFAGELPDDED